MSYFQKKKAVRVIIKCPEEYCGGAYNNVTGLLMSRYGLFSDIRIDDEFWKAVSDRGYILQPKISNKYVFPLSQQNFLLKNE
jgi:hypothetical protein